MLIQERTLQLKIFDR